MATAGEVRQRAREDMRRAIVDAARDRLASEGPAQLSLRAVARDVGMVSSAVYRYVPSRDALLTALIIEAYDALGAAAERAEDAVGPEDLRERWRALCRGARTWAHEHPHEWALIFGTPVVGYAAPEDTVPAATRIPRRMVELLHDAVAAGTELPDDDVADDVVATVGPLREFFGEALPVEVVVRGLMAWTHLAGAISHELFGHRRGTVDRLEVFFDAEMERVADFIGLR